MRVTVRLGFALQCFSLSPFSGLGMRSTSLLMNTALWQGHEVTGHVVQPRQFFCTTPLSRLRMRSRRMYHVPRLFDDDIILIRKGVGLYHHKHIAEL